MMVVCDMLIVPANQGNSEQEHVSCTREYVKFCQAIRSVLLGAIILREINELHR